MQEFKIQRPYAEIPSGAPVNPPPSVPTAAQAAYGPWPDELLAPERKPSPWRWLYLPASFLIGLMIEDAGGSLGGRMTSALTLVGICSFVAAAFYIWRKATRAAIPATTFILAFLVTGGVLADQQSQEEKQAEVLHETASRFATATRLDESIPTDVEARIAWASSWAMSDVNDHYDELESERDIDSREYPEAWLAARYFADAGDYAEVRSYFQAYRDYVVEADSTTPAVYNERYRARLIETGYNAQQAVLMASSVPREAADAMKARRELFQVSARLANSALVLHDYLVRTDARAHYHGKTGLTRFEREGERRRANSLLEAVQGLLSERETLQAANYALWQQQRRAAASGNP
ncbi:MAG TPA: hypothetical protein VLK84_09110 [Longimicrobium sp.]|nr:hypothetical protein [Longimicrobium sp.]